MVSCSVFSEKPESRRSTKEETRERLSDRRLLNQCSNIKLSTVPLTDHISRNGDRLIFSARNVAGGTHPSLKLKLGCPLLILEAL